LEGGRIQAFPWSSWKNEFAIASAQGFRAMEWTLDYAQVRRNPLLTVTGRAEIREISRRWELRIPSLTGDCFMQAPFWKAVGSERAVLKNEFLAVAEACSAIGISIIVVPLVDHGRLDDDEQQDEFVSFMAAQTNFLRQKRLKIAVESDLPPRELARLFDRLDPGIFGINYDIGNSAALGYDPIEEISVYGNRIINIHVKDRTLGGTTVPLGMGHADFKVVFAQLARVGYRGNYMLQTARAADGDHLGVLLNYRAMTLEWLKSTVELA
jgi:L-ribulose-5-phosphate 3-epimerase